MASKKKVTRKTFSPETKAEAVRLLSEEGYTIKQAAEHAGCSINAIQNWKAAAKKGKVRGSAKASKDGAAQPTAKSAKKVRRTKKARRGRRGRKPVTVVHAGTVPAFTFEEFAQNYWSEYKGASDVLRLPSDVVPKAVEYINNVLRYAYDQFCE